MTGEARNLVVVVTSDGRVELRDRVTGALGQVLYTPASPVERAVAASVERDAAGNPSTYITKGTTNGCYNAIRVDSKGIATGVNIAGSGIQPVAGGLLYTEMATAEKNFCRASALILRANGSGVETRWELSAEDLKTYSGVQVQAVSPDGQTAAILLSTPEAGSDVAVLKLGDRGPLLKTARIVPRPSANERLGNPHFSAGVLYATVYSFDVNAVDPPRRLVTVDQADLRLGVPAFQTPTAWITLRVDPTGREVIWSGKGAEEGNIYISTLGKADKRVLTIGSDVTSVSGL